MTVPISHADELQHARNIQIVTGVGRTTTAAGAIREASPRHQHTRHQQQHFQHGGGDDDTGNEEDTPYYGKQQQQQQPKYRVGSIEPDRTNNGGGGVNESPRHVTMNGGGGGPPGGNTVIPSTTQPRQRTPSATTPTNNGGGRRKKAFAVSTRWERTVAEHGPVRDCHSYCCCLAKRVGNMFVLWERPDGSPLVVAGPCWQFCCFVTVPMILGISGAIAYYLILNEESPLPYWIAYIYFPVLGFVLAALFCVSCQDPGLMERVTDEEAGEGGWFWNEQVGSYRPPGALYCRECGVLIQDYDHLCPWTGTGIGRRNMLAFKVFVVGVNILCYFSVILVIIALLHGLRVGV